MGIYVFLGLLNEYFTQNDSNHDFNLSETQYLSFWVHFLALMTKNVRNGLSRTSPIAYRS